MFIFWQFFQMLICWFMGLLRCSFSDSFFRYSFSRSFLRCSFSGGLHFWQHFRGIFRGVFREQSGTTCVMLISVFIMAASPVANRRLNYPKYCKLVRFAFKFRIKRLLTFPYLRSAISGIWTAPRFTGLGYFG